MLRIDHATIDPQIRELRKSEPDLSAAAIARRLRAAGVKIGEDSVRTCLTRMGFKVINNAQIPAQNAEIAALHQAGHTGNYIAAAVGLSPAVVRKRIAVLGLGRRSSKRLSKPKLPPKPQQEYRTFPKGYPRELQNGRPEIPPYVRTLPVLPSISGPKFGNDHYYKCDEGSIPLAIADSGDESGGSGGSDSPSAD